MTDDSPIDLSSNESCSARDFRSLSRSFNNFLDDAISAVNTSEAEFASRYDLVEAEAKKFLSCEALNAPLHAIAFLRPSYVRPSVRQS